MSIPLTDSFIPQAPLKKHNNGMTLHSTCFTCKRLIPQDRLDFFDGANICDECADEMRPARYSAELFTITQQADVQARRCVTMTLAELVGEGQIVLIEDEFGDLVYSSQNSSDLFLDEPVPGGTAALHLPDTMRPTHRQMQRESLDALQERCYVATAVEHHWQVDFHPFEVEGDRFTLGLFRSI